MTGEVSLDSQRQCLNTIQTIGFHLVWHGIVARAGSPQPVGNSQNSILSTCNIGVYDILRKLIFPNVGVDVN